MSGTKLARTAEVDCGNFEEVLRAYLKISDRRQPNRREQLVFNRLLKHSRKCPKCRGTFSSYLSEPEEDPKMPYGIF
jgi:hypothetical protein